MFKVIGFATYTVVVAAFGVIGGMLLTVAAEEYGRTSDSKEA